MNYTLLFLKEAETEFEESYLWYEKQQINLGDKFAEEVYKRLELISKFPERYPQRLKGYRESPINIFPYIIIYKFDRTKRQIAVISIFQTNRNPAKKYKK